MAHALDGTGATSVARDSALSGAKPSKQKAGSIAASGLFGVWWGVSDSNTRPTD
jgi:hypothetical protein